MLVAMPDDALADFERRTITVEDEPRTVYVAGQGPDESSPVARYLRGLARLAHVECGGLGVGAIGMCFTGNFALGMMLESSVLAPVLCQPSLPLNEPGGLEIAPDELIAVRQRLEREDLAVRAYRFDGDRYCTAQRFAAYAAALAPASKRRCFPRRRRSPSRLRSSRRSSAVPTASSPRTSSMRQDSRPLPPGTRSSPSSRRA
jgi:hypothetical protein